MYIYCIYWTKLPVAFGFFIGLGVWGSELFLQGEVVGVFFSLWFSLFLLGFL